MDRKKSGFSVSSAFFLQLSLGVFFIMLGYLGVKHHDSAFSQFARALGKDDTMNLVMAIIEMAMGAVLVLGLFFSVSSGLARLFSIALFILWAFYMAVSYFMNDFGKPEWATWLYTVSWHAIILVSLWMVGRKYMN
ncbi:MAG TPA: hypothetical protein VMC79_01495 [Rectinemataceae bacterium]|nr:hypothetical protein [Rectinemataceae bacterium]